MFGNCINVAGAKLKACLILDVQTRLNSTYHMLKRAIQYREAFDNLEKFDRRTYKFLPTAEEWKRAEKMCGFLNPFTEINCLMSGSNYPTSNLYIYKVREIHNWLQVNEEREDDIFKHMVIPMKEKFDKYLEEVSDVFTMASVFDPRLKLTLSEYCLWRLYMSTCDLKLKNLSFKMDTLSESCDKISNSAHRLKSHVRRLQKMFMMRDLRQCLTTMM